MITFKFTPGKNAGRIFAVELPLHPLGRVEEGLVSVPLELYLPFAQLRRGDADILQDRITKAVEKMVAELNRESD